jgi:hypothetical protein
LKLRFNYVGLALQGRVPILIKCLNICLSSHEPALKSREK